MGFIEELGDIDRLNSLEGGEEAWGMLRNWVKSLHHLCERGQLTSQVVVWPFLHSLAVLYLLWTTHNLLNRNIYVPGDEKRRKLATWQQTGFRENKEGRPSASSLGHSYG